MPQMMPLWWVTLFSLFSLTLISFSIINYFLTYQKPNLNLKQGKFNKLNNWKW
uniref:ATP synthase F0 subunit 8 n=1 Tax=Theopompa ophthalmica TaxID=2908871 RepID=UPI003001AB3C